MSKCSVCGKETVITDSPDGVRYHSEDTCWIIPPNFEDDDPGVLGPMPGAKSVYEKCERPIEQMLEDAAEREKDIEEDW